MNKWIGVFISLAAVSIFLGRPHFDWLKESTDSIGIAILAVAMLPWLGSILDSLKITGFGEAKFRDLEKGIAAAKRDAADAKEVASVAEELYLSPIDDNQSVKKSGDWISQLQQLANKYISTRELMKSGGKRTAEMTTIFRQMMNVARKINKSEYDLSGDLRSKSVEKNIGALAYSYVFPTNVSIDDLIHTIKRSKQPFIQYWGLRSIQNVISHIGIEPFSIQNVQDLRNLMASFNRNNDRYNVIERINRNLDGYLDRDPK